LDEVTLKSPSDSSIQFCSFMLIVDTVIVHKEGILEGKSYTHSFSEALANYECYIIKRIEHDSNV